MRCWDDWADEHWDMVALALAFTTALAFAVSLALAFNAFTLRPAERAAAPGALVVEDAHAPRDTREP